MTEPAAIRLTRTLPHSPAEVWAALTDPARHATWWAAGDIRPVVGHRFTLDMGKWGMQPCEVLAAEAASRLSYAFAPGVLNTVITWSLAPEGTARGYRSSTRALTWRRRRARRRSRACAPGGRW